MNFFIKTKKPSVAERVQEIREDANRFATMRLARRNLRLKLGYFESKSTWDKYLREQPGNVAYLNSKLGN